ncbi:MAG: hypothetical protein ACOYN0_14465 [Phycisphaerales bacterium]
MRRVLVLALTVGLAGVAQAQTYLEVEGNDTRATANVIASMVSGESFGGTSSAASGVGLDYWRVGTAAAPLGIYRHTLTMNNTAFTASIRNLSVTTAPADTLAGVPWDGVAGTVGPTEGNGQSSFGAVSELNSWYGFGRNESVMYRINGSSPTTALYQVSLTSALVTPVNIGTFQQGQIAITTFAQGHTTDTDMWVYDSNLNAMVGYGNDDESPLGGTPGTGASVQSYLNRNYAPGTYYLALSNFNVMNSLASPSDDDFRTGGVLEFGDAVLTSSATTGLNLSFAVSDSAGTVRCL